MSEGKISFRSRLIREVKEMGILFAYLAVFFVAFTTYRRLILSEYRIGYAHYCYAIFEALVLSKVILIGRILKIGRRFSTHPLIVPTLYKTITFSLFIMIFVVLEHICDGLLHHEAFSAVRARFMSIGVSEMVVRAMVVCTALFPLFAMEEIGGVVGEGKLREWLFFRRPTEAKVREAVTQNSEE
jgi:hypothetical protein